MRLVPQKRQEEFDGLDEVIFADGDREVDRIEVGLAAEATSEVRLGVDRRFRLPAARTDEYEAAITMLVWPVQVPDQAVDGNLVTQAP